MAENVKQHEIPGGHAKGTPLEHAKDKDIQYWLDTKREALANNPTGQYSDRDRAWVAAAESELQSRLSPKAMSTAQPATAQQQSTTAPQQTAPLQTALATTQPQALAIQGAYSDAMKAEAALLEAAARFHLVATSPSVGSLPDGCEVMLSLIQVDQATETYAITGRRGQPSDDDTLGLDKTALNKISGAAGLTWDPVLSGRLDDGRDPHYCHYRAVGYVRAFDGQILTRKGEVEIDARAGSPLIDEITTKAQKADRSPDNQILELRKFLLRHAESKAQNRAIRSLGVRTSYKRGELGKPFAVAKVIFTGKSKDPEASREFRQMIGESFMSGTRALYGAPRGMLPAPARHIPPPVGDAHPDIDITPEPAGEEAY
jgi:hypothetical protein